MSKRIVEVNPDGRGENYYEVFDTDHANPQNQQGWVATLNKKELISYRKVCGEHTFVPHIELLEGASWEDTLEKCLIRKGVPTSHTLQGYWDNEIEQLNEEGIEYKQSMEIEVTKKVASCLACNLNDMSKEDAITTLVEIYAEEVL